MNRAEQKKQDKFARKRQIKKNQQQGGPKEKSDFFYEFIPTNISTHQKHAARLAEWNNDQLYKEIGYMTDHLLKKVQKASTINLVPYDGLDIFTPSGLEIITDSNNKFYFGLKMIENTDKSNMVAIHYSDGGYALPAIEVNPKKLKYRLTNILNDYVRF